MPQRREGFGDPYEVETPPGAEGWEGGYPYYALFLDGRREQDGARTWFRSSLHFSEPMPPFDLLVAECALASTGAMNSRVFAVPPSLGIELRVVNGYVYMATNEVTDPDELARRTAEFTHRAGYVYAHWDELYAAWEARVRARIADLDAVVVPALPHLEPAGREPGTTTRLDLLTAWRTILGSLEATWDLHSELLNLGYAAYLSFLSLCRSAFPEISDQQVARMVAGIDVLLLRPDEELKRLAALAVELGVDPALPAGLDALAGTAAGDRFLAAWRASAEPWFHFSNGNGFYHHHRSWSDDPAFPAAAVAAYAARLRAGERLDRPSAWVGQDRDDVVATLRAVLDGAERDAFDAALGLCRTVFPYVENHNFFVEHWYMTRFWAKVREVGACLVGAGVLEAVDDVFFLRAGEIGDALADVALAWCGGGTPAGGSHWPALVARRREVHAALRAWQAPPVLGPAPPAITDPMTIMLWGITDERVAGWLDDGRAGDGSAGDGSAGHEAAAEPARGVRLVGSAASAGVAEGRARVVLDPSGLDALRDGEILVAPVTSPSWTPVFARIAGAVSDIGGIMCHAAIVCREYRLPAVVGTGSATRTIRTGQRVRVDGDTGVVTVLDA